MRNPVNGSRPLKVRCPYCSMSLFLDLPCPSMSLFRVSKEVYAVFMQQRTQQRGDLPPPPNGIEPSAAQLAGKARKNSRGVVGGGTGFLAFPINDDVNKETITNYRISNVCMKISSMILTLILSFWLARRSCGEQRA